MNLLTQKVEELILGLMCKKCNNFLVDKEMFIKRLFKQLFCKHVWIKTFTIETNGKSCRKCGRFKELYL